MRAMRCHQWGKPEDLRLEEVPAPDLAATHPDGTGVLITVAAAALNFADSLMIAGRYQEKPAFPFSPGLEVSGTVAAVGPAVRHVGPGDRVMAVLNHGGFAEQAVAAAGDVFAIPDDLDFATAAGVPIVYGTAFGGLVWRAALRPGETLMVHGAAGGAGLAAVEVGKALGARVIATAGGPEKVALARAHGADDGIDYKTEDIRARGKALTGGRGADVVFDPVGGSAFEASLRCIAWEGRIVVVGFAGGDVPQVPANILLVKNCAVLGLYWGAYRRHDPDLVADSFREMLPWIADGRLRPHVSRRFPLEAAAAALNFLLARKSTGKVVLEIPQAGQ